MLRIIQNNSAAGAMSYYSTADYYSEGQELLGQWRGQGAERLGLAGGIDKATWDALCDNRDPSTGLPLTAAPQSGTHRRLRFQFPRSQKRVGSVRPDTR